MSECKIVEGESGLAACADERDKLRAENERLKEQLRLCNIDQCNAEAENEKLKTIIKKLDKLCEEIRYSHTDPGDAIYYNHCDNGEECLWCVETKQLAEEACDE